MRTRPLCGVSPHYLCGGCKCVLPHRAFSAAQARLLDDDRRRCRSCVGTLPCAACGVVLPASDFPQRPTGTRWHPARNICRSCRGSAGTAPTVPVVPCSPPHRVKQGAAQLFWRWAVAVTKALTALPADVQLKALSFLAVSGGVAELGGLVVCVICDRSWLRAVKVAPTWATQHRGCREHRARLAAWKNVA
eukprot:NODE_13103_length_1185_cov_1.883743.p3 GENE.NODE_13103_length_1185_cov_1.883743~~NODE_13103_length_1185_cov_1.883743.p3  ORF type:complete len:191 (-),score=50.30 NODE_13103_length_1185_cov_1.883743:492-1064(-)